MSRRDGAFVKKMRLTEISRIIAKTFPAGCDFEKLVKQLEFQMGFREYTARKYIDTVIQGQGWILLDGMIKAE